MKWNTLVLLYKTFTEMLQSGHWSIITLVMNTQYTLTTVFIQYSTKIKSFFSQWSGYLLFHSYILPCLVMIFWWFGVMLTMTPSCTSCLHYTCCSCCVGWIGVLATVHIRKSLGRLWVILLSFFWDFKVLSCYCWLDVRQHYNPFKFALVKYPNQSYILSLFFSILVKEIPNWVWYFV